MSALPSKQLARPRLGFVGVGWIGQARMRALAESGVAELAAVADPSAELRDKAREFAPGALFGEHLEDLLKVPLDGLVIATPSALHPAQSARALEHGLAVFCQKPLARTAAETHDVLNMARRADRLLAVDFCYRFTAGMQVLKGLVDAGDIGPIYHARLVFHNAYGPDKAWYYDLASAGGGCMMDLGSHLVDLALWVLGFPRIDGVQAALYAGGQRLAPGASKVEDFASARLHTASGAALDITCSWNMPAGQDAVISAEFHGTQGGLRFENLQGSFYDFQLERLHKTQRHRLVSPPDSWGGRGIVAFAEALARGGRFAESAHELSSVAEVLDRIYERA